MIAPVIELPAIRAEGREAMLSGMLLRMPTYPLGFTFCPYKIGSTQRANFLMGCVTACFGPQG